MWILLLLFTIKHRFSFYFVLCEETMTSNGYILKIPIIKSSSYTCNFLSLFSLVVWLKLAKKTKIKQSHLNAVRWVILFSGRLNSSPVWQQPWIEDEKLVIVSSPTVINTCFIHLYFSSLKLLRRGYYEKNRL